MKKRIKFAIGCVVGIELALGLMCFLMMEVL